MAKKHSKAEISDATKADAMKIAKGTQKPGQTKEQTKLIAQGIEKGIAEYKKREKQKSRERDKQRKQELKAKLKETETELVEEKPAKSLTFLPWILLAASWIGFTSYLFMSK